MLMLSDGDTLYLKHNGVTRVYKNPSLYSVNESTQSRAVENYAFNSELKPRPYLDNALAGIDLDFRFECSNVEIIDEDIDFKISQDEELSENEVEKKILKEKSVNDLLDIINNKVKERKNN